MRGLRGRICHILVSGNSWPIANGKHITLIDFSLHIHAASDGGSRVRESWQPVYGDWAMAPGSWLMAHGSCPLVPGPRCACLPLPLATRQSDATTVTIAARQPHWQLWQWNNCIFGPHPQSLGGRMDGWALVGDEGAVALGLLVSHFRHTCNSIPFRDAHIDIHIHIRIRLYWAHLGWPVLRPPYFVVPDWRQEQEKHQPGSGHVNADNFTLSEGLDQHWAGHWTHDKRTKDAWLGHLDAKRQSKDSPCPLTRARLQFRFAFVGALRWKKYQIYIFYIFFYN